MSCGAVRPDVPASAAAHCIFSRGKHPKEKPPTEALAVSSVSVIFLSSLSTSLKIMKQNFKKQMKQKALSRSLNSSKY